jgi:hypothetical protein
MKLLSQTPNLDPLVMLGRMQEAILNTAETMKAIQEYEYASAKMIEIEERNRQIAPEGAET